MDEQTKARTTAGWIGLIVGPLAAILLLGGPQWGMSLDPQRPELNAMAAVASLMAVWWVTEALPLAATALLPLVLFPVLAIMPSSKTAAAYGEPMIFLFLGGFIIALGVERCGLHRRVALAIVAAVGDSPRQVVLGFMLATAALSMWISNTATTLLLLPIATSVLAQANSRDDPAGVKRFGIALLLGIAYSASIGGFATLIGTPPNIAMVTIFNQAFPDAPTITFGSWMLLALPLSVTYLMIAWFVLVYLVFPLGKSPLLGGGHVIAEARRKLGPISSAELRMSIVVATTAALWIFREPVAGWGWASLLGWDQPGKLPAVGDANIAILMALVCFVVPGRGLRGAPLMDWQTAVRLPWGILLLFGGGLALARGMQASGLDQHLGNWLGAQLAGTSNVMMAGGTALAMTFFTELTSNLASVNMSLPILARMAQSVQCDPLLIMIPATIAASCAFMLPVATPPNAIVFGSGKIEVRHMIKAGIWLNLIGVVLIVLFLFLLGVPVLGITTDGVPEWAG